MYIKIENQTIIPIKNIRDTYDTVFNTLSLQIEIDGELCSKSVEQLYNEAFNSVESIELFDESDVLKDTFIGFNKINKIEKYYYADHLLFSIILTK